MGKTHLLEGMTQAMRSRSVGGSVVLTTAEAFTNSFLDAMRASGLGAFRQRFRRPAALLVDDIHFLAAKRATQDEFLHTFNALMEAEVPIVLATDTHPRSIPKLSEELATRFLGGMLVRIDAPDLATRKAIVLAKAESRGVELPEPVADFLAEHLRSSVRELEGALQTVMAHAQLTGRKLDLALARSALRDTIRHTNANLALRDVERAVCEVFQLEGESLRSETRARTVAQPRMLAMYLARKHTRAAFGEIGRHFGDRNHSTVIAAIRRVESWLRDETRISLLSGFESVHDLVATLEQRLGSV
jgi:chromosomal replication initiator protein